MPQMASMEKNDPIDNLVEHLKYKYKDQDNGQNTHRLHQKGQLILHLDTFVFLFVSLCSVLFCIS